MFEDIVTVYILEIKEELEEKKYTLMSLIFAGTKFCGFRGLGGHPRNLIPAK